MSLAENVLPYGMRDIKLREMADDGSLGVAVDLPAARKLSFTDSEDFETLRGDDVVQATRGQGTTLTWELEAGGIKLEAYAIMAGGEVTTTGLTPNLVKTFTKNNTDARPYFQIEGKAISDSGGDFHGIIYKARATEDITGEMADGQFWLTGASGEGIGRASDGKVYDFVQNETATDIAAGINEIQLVTVSATSGTFTLTYSGQTTAAIAEGASEAVLQAALEALSNIAPGDVEVEGPPGGPWTVTFEGTLAATNVAQMTGDGTNLVGGAQTVTITTLQQGSAT